MNAPSAPLTPRRPPSRTRRIVMWTMFVLILIPSGLGFLDKLVQFFRTLAADRGGGFTLLPISNYLLVSAGMFCLLAWAIAHGMFRDVEAPKYTMLERENELERLESRAEDSEDSNEPL